MKKNFTFKERIERFFLWFAHKFTGHDVPEFICNIYGDVISAFNGKRSFWVCSTCGASIYKDDLY